MTNADRAKTGVHVCAAPTAGAVFAAGAATAAGAPAASAPATLQQARALQQFLAGGIAGAVYKTLVALLRRVSTMLMADGQRFSMGQAAQHAWRGGPFRGHAATLIKIFPASAIQFAVFNGMKDHILARRREAQQVGAALAAAALHGSMPSAGGVAAGAGTAAARAAPPQQEAELANHERLLAGAAAGAAATCACYPLESMRTMMSVAGGVRGNLLQVAQQVLAAGGPAALCRGFRASLVGDVLGNSLGFTAYEIGTRLYTTTVGAPPPPHLRGVIGAASAALVVTLTMPLEVVRRRLQVQGLAGRPVLYRGTLDCLRQVARREGVRGFYAASLPSYLKVAPSIGCMYALYEMIMAAMSAAPVQAATVAAGTPAVVAAAPAAARAAAAAQ